MTQLIGALMVGTIPMLTLAVLFVGFEIIPLGLAFAGYLVGGFFSVLLMRRGFPHALLGFGNLTTILRLAIISALLAPLAAVAWTWAVVVVATLALVLDGVDGWLARREGRVSSFGARLDMEVDSAFAMVLALNAWATGSTGVEVLLLGLPRYLFIATAQFLPWLNKSAPARFSGKVVCVVQLAALIALNAPIMPDFLVWPVMLAVMGALIWSFGHDIVWLWRNRT